MGLLLIVLLLLLFLALYGGIAWSPLLFILALAIVVIALFSWHPWGAGRRY